jgi:mercuric reductase
MTVSNPSAVDAEPCGWLRPGVVYPDWSAAPSVAARKALAAIVAATGEVEGWCGCGESADRVRHAILKGYAEWGRAPAPAELRDQTGLSRDEFGAALDELTARDMIVRSRADGSITGAYPFTDAETGHRVRLEGQCVNAMCAIDALGAASMLDRDVAVEGVCADCGGGIRIETTARGRRIGAAKPEAACVWAGVRCDGAAAASLCPTIVFFCSERHRAGWAADRTGEGIALSLNEALETGCALFSPLLRKADAS